MENVKVSIVGGSGYAGGELLRLLLFHPNVDVMQVSSARYFGKLVHNVHPNLRKVTTLKYCSLMDIKDCDLLFLCLPHGASMVNIDVYRNKAKKIIDLSADFRLRSEKVFKKWYKKDHGNPHLLKKFIYGIPELHRHEIKNANYVSSAGCNATAAILALYPLYKNNLVIPDRTVVDVKVGSSEGGNKGNDASHHPVRSGCVRSFAPTGHRHVAEIEQELGIPEKTGLHFSATSIDMVRGILATSHVFLKENLSEKDIWKMYRKEYGDEPFIRIVKERDGNYRYPEPKLLAGTNYCDIGFQRDNVSNRLVVISAIDNLMKGAAGQAVQVFNIMYGFDETSALMFPGLHPI